MIVPSGVRGTEARGTYGVVIRSKNQDGVLSGTVLPDGLKAWGDRPPAIPTIKDTWPEAVKRLSVLMGDKACPMGQHIVTLFLGLPSTPRNLGGGICGCR